MFKYFLYNNLMKRSRKQWNLTLNSATLMQGKTVEHKEVQNQVAGNWNSATLIVQH